MAQLINTDLGGIPNFDCEGEPTTVGARWQKWKRAFQLFVASKGIEHAAQKKALLLHCGGMKMQDIYFTFPAARDPGQDQLANASYQTVLRTLYYHDWTV